MTIEPRRRRPHLVLGVSAAVIAAWFAAAQLVRSVEPLGLDQGLFACFTRWVPRGILPYRDLFDSKPPLFLYSYALAHWIPAELTHSIWWLEAFWLGAILALTYALGARVWDRITGLVCAALMFSGLWAPGFGGYWSRAQADEFVALPLVAAAWLAWSALDRPRLAFWAGVVTGVAGLYKIPSMAVAAAWPLTWILVRSLRTSWSRIALMSAGILAPWALAAAWFAAHGAFDDFIDGVFVYHRYNAAYIAPPWSYVLKSFSTQLLSSVPLLAGAAAFGVIVLKRRRAREAHWVVPWMVLTMAAVALERQLAGYQFLLIVPGLALAGGFGLVELARLAAVKGSARAASLAALAAALALALVTGAQWWSAYGIDALHYTGRLTRGEYLRRLQPAGFSSAAEEEAARYVRDRTTPTDGVLVWGLSPGLYALADRHPVTRYPFHKLLLTDAPLSRMIPGLDDRRARFLSGLAADPPVYIVVGHRDANGFEPQDSFSSMMRFTPLRDLIEHHYRPETEIGTFVIFRRRAGLIGD